MRSFRTAGTGPFVPETFPVLKKLNRPAVFTGSVRYRRHVSFRNRIRANTAYSFRVRRSSAGRFLPSVLFLPFPSRSLPALGPRVRIVRPASFRNIHARTPVLLCTLQNGWPPRAMNNRYCTFDKYPLFNYHFERMVITGNAVGTSYAHITIIVLTIILLLLLF